ncbi:MAG: GAF and ANTAR domain-containing protein [Nocardioides sp.]
MEPIPESIRAAEELDPGVDEIQLLDELRTHSERVTALVPDCLGMSVAIKDLGVTLTLVSTSRQAALLDAMQYLNSGPCVDAAEQGDVLACTADELLSEESWQLFSRSARASGVASTLTLPVIADGEVRGTLNLYASTPHAFDGHHQALADALGAWAAGATTNADLSFSTLDTARQAPRVLADQAIIETATGFVMAAAQLSVAEAHRRIGDAARRAGISEVQVAESVVAAGRHQESWPQGLDARSD